MAVVIVGISVAVDEVPSRGELRRVERGRARVHAPPIRPVGDSGVEHRHDRSIRARRGRARRQKGRIAGRVHGGEIPSLRVCAAADEDPIRLRRRDPRQAAQRIQRALQIDTVGQDGEVERSLPDHGDDRSYRVQGRRAQVGQHRRIAAHDHLLRRDHLWQPVDHLRDVGDGSGPARQGHEDQDSGGYGTFAEGGHGAK